MPFVELDDSQLAFFRFWRKIRGFLQRRILPSKLLFLMIYTTFSVNLAQRRCMSRWLVGVVPLLNSGTEKHLGCIRQVGTKVAASSPLWSLEKKVFQVSFCYEPEKINWRTRPPGSVRWQYVYFFSDQTSTSFYIFSIYLSKSPFRANTSVPPSHHICKVKKIRKKWW